MSAAEVTTAEKQNLMKRQPKGFSPALERCLSTYAMAASAAGVGLLALTQSAEAKIIYTPANISIPVNGGEVYLDLNNDGVNDFWFTFVVSTEKRIGLYQGADLPLEGNHATFLAVVPAQPSNRIWAVESKSRLCAAAVKKGRTVGPRRPFQPGYSGLPMAWAWGNSMSGGYGCPWIKATSGYLGLKFEIQGKIHFGWARVKTHPVYITGYAYETVANKPLVTGQRKGPDVVTVPPATLGRLAQGRR